MSKGKNVKKKRSSKGEGQTCGKEGKSIGAEI